MLFYISRDFGKSLSSCVDCQEVLFSLIDSRKSGIHLIYADNNTNKLINKYLSENSIYHQRIYNNIQKNFREKKGILNKLTKLIFLTSNRRNKISENGRLIIIPAQKAKNSQITYPTLLLGENLNDCTLYALKIAKNYIKSIPNEIKHLNINDRRFESGGGNSTHYSYERYKSKNIDLCLCIADSDRSFPQAVLGDTAKFIKEKDKKYNNPLCKLEIIDFYSIENLIPLDLTIEINSDGKSKEHSKKLSEELEKIKRTVNWKYLPMKKGFKCCDLQKVHHKGVFWSKNFTDLGIRANCCETETCSNTVLESVSEKTLIRSIDYNDESWSLKLNIETNSILLDAYEKITKEVKSWLCSGNEIRVY